MERVARLAARERSELFAESAARMGATPAVVEKDFRNPFQINLEFVNELFLSIKMLKK